MDGLIFFAVIIFFSIVESISRSRKAKQKLQDGTAEPELFEWAQTPRPEVDVSTFDEEPSYDEAPEQEDDGIRREPLRSNERPYETAPTTTSEPRVPTSGGAGMTGAEVAADMWAEIKALGMRAVEESTAPKPPISRQSPHLPEATPRPELVRTPRPEPVARPLPQTPAAEVQGLGTSPRPEHEIHLSHADYGTDPSERAPSEQDGMDPLAKHLGADAAAVRARLSSHDVSALREAIILQEVLGPPAALQKDRFE